MTPYRKNTALRPSIPQEGSGQAFSPYRNMGFSLIEVLVTIVILLVGLLGLAGLQARALTAQMESYQRSQALILLRDMADRIEANRNAATCYNITDPATGTSYLGTSSTLPIPAVATCATALKTIYDACHAVPLPSADATAAATTAVADMNEWHNALLGAAETQGTNKVGAMIGARGCVSQIVAPACGVPGEYLVAVAWQGFNSTAAPAINCGAGVGNYGSSDALRRVVALPISIADLLP